MRFKHCTYLFLLIGYSLPSLLSAQNKKYLMAQGQKSLDEKDYFSAAQYYNQLIIYDSTQVFFQYKYAEASRLNYDYDIAFHWYEKLYDADNGKFYVETPLWMGMILKSKGRYKEAKRYFEKFYKKSLKDKDKSRKVLYDKAKQEIDACETALILLAHPLDVKVEHLDTAVNSKVSEYAPVELDTVLYFSSLRNPEGKKRRDANNITFNKLYTARKEQEKFRKAKELDSLFNANGIHNANTAFSSDFTKIFVSRCSALNTVDYTCQIYFSQHKNGHWENLKVLPAPINLFGSNTTQPSVSTIDGREVLFFSSNRPGGKGGMDIWYSFFSTVGDNLKFSLPVNAGKRVNSLEDEITPWYVPEKNTLYFSSTWHKGLGGFDIFQSEYKNEEFGEPVNAGYPINSSYNDIYYSLNSKKDKAYISSNRIGSYFEEKQSCCNDIYSFSVPSFSVPPAPVDTTKLIIDQMKVLCPLTLYFHNDEPDPRTKNITTKLNYKKTYDDYQLLKPKYLAEYAAGLPPSEKELAENKVNIFFEDSVDAGMADLDKFAALLESVLLRGEKVKITMKGYCSPLASTDYNVNLAKRRISSLRNYFAEYKGGIFVKYIDNQNPDEGSIVYTDVDIGELTVSKVSDSVKDVKNSVYSPYAAVERKIQIIAVSSFFEARENKVKDK